MFNTLILLLIILAAFSLVWWGINALPMPQQLKVIILVILGLIALAFIWNQFAGGGPVAYRLR
jgi:hypothetical protein